MTTDTFTSLADSPLFVVGDDIEVWYYRDTRSVFGTIFEDGLPSLADLSRTHALLGTIGGLRVDNDACGNEFDVLDRLFDALQGENYSPNGEAREIVASANLSHTSMSVGDVIHFKNGNTYVCANVGWRNLV